MKRIIKQSPLWLAPAVLAGAALLACNDGRTAESRANTTRPEIDAPASPQPAECSGLGSADAFLPGSRHVPKC